MDFNNETQEESAMKLKPYVTILAILNALLLCFSGSFAEAGQAKGGASHRAGRASSHMSSRGEENTNAQWSADPERGWVRAKERRDMHEERRSAPDLEENHGKHKGRGVKGKAKGLERNH